MTSRRTSANAYERSKRGLANGGVAPLGYRRDKKRKGHLVVDPAESRVVQAIFRTYLKEQSIKRVVEKVGKDHRGQKLARSKVHSILTNKAYIGVRAIYKRDAANAQEVPAVWEPIIAKATFEKVQAALSKNREQYNRHADRGRFVYLFSGLIRCGECGQKLQGKSAWSSSTGRRYHYYAHPRACPEHGIPRIDATVVHRIVLDWLRDIARDSERSEKLRKEGAKRIGRRTAELKQALKRIDTEKAALEAEIDARIAELTRTDTESVRRSIQASVTRLESQNDEKAQERLYVEQEIGQLDALAGDPAAFEGYRKAIRAGLAAVEEDGRAGKDAKNLGALLAGLSVTREHMRIALSGLVNRSATSSTLSVLAPPAGLEPAT